MENEKTVKEILNDLKKVSAYAPLSVIIPCYNNEKTIEGAILSVAHQSWRPEEIILVDDSSTDKTLEVIDRLKEKIGKDWIKVIFSPKNQGPSVSRNIGWNNSNKEYIAFLDADDFWNKDKIAIQMYYMIKNPNIFLSGHKYLCHKKNKNYDFSSMHFSKIPIKEISKKKWLFGNYYSVPGVIIKRNLTHRFLDFQNYTEDYSLWLRIAFDGYKTPLIDLPLAYGNKLYFWEKGLSRNIWQTEKGELYNFLCLFKEKKIGLLKLCLIFFWSVLKYFRRVILFYYFKVVFFKKS